MKTTYPKLLLLDEIDAHLHPTMVKQLLDTIRNVLVEKHGVSVIMTTHSPTTVALSPEEALYSMTVGVPGIQKTTKGRALNLLTAGVPTLSIDHSGRRQVFVEGSSDAEIYSSVYTLLKPQLDNDRSLNFISTGTKNPETGAENNTGCNRVVAIVDGLRKNGNNSVFGIVDWDNKTVRTSNCFVFAEKERYAIENAIFDPLLLIGLILKEYECKDVRTKVGLPCSMTFLSFAQGEYKQSQIYTSNIQQLVLPNDSHEAVQQIEYAGGYSNKVSEAFLRKQAHLLEDAIRDSIPQLKGHRFKDLKRYMVETVFQEIPAIVPKCFLNVFAEILQADNYQ